MEKKQIDLENITLEELKEAYEHLSAENEKLKDTLKTKEQTLNYTWEQSDRLTKRIDELKGTLRSFIKLAESELK